MCAKCVEIDELIAGHRTAAGRSEDTSQADQIAPLIRELIYQKIGLHAVPGKNKNTE